MGAYLVALYLPGLPRSFEVKRSHWRAVSGCLRRTVAGPGLQVESGLAVSALEQSGFHAEACIIRDRQLLLSAEQLLHTGQVISADCDPYPSRWRPGVTAVPPALWVAGNAASDLAAPQYIGIVGNREIRHSEEAAFCRGAAKEVDRLGMKVITGGAIGCDALAIQAAPPGSLVVPATGMAHMAYDVLQLVQAAGVIVYSPYSPGSVFSTAAAMERNSLIYLAAEATLVVSARLRQGGSWHGAVSALRKGHKVIVRDDGSSAAQALIALGAVPITQPVELASAIYKEGMQPSLFSVSA